MENDRQDEIGTVLGRVASGVFILTARNDESQETGMLCSWVQQASFSPPMVTIAVRRDRYISDWLKTTQLAALSVIGESDKRMLGHFGRGFDIGEPAFEGLDITRGVTGIPVLSATLGYLEGRIVSQFPAGDHLIHVMEITGAGAGEKLPAERPMIHLRKSGFNY